jgi:prepilin-type N-terminal cleavage/methylation domain-containing protein
MKQRRSQGFTLIELLVVIAIIAILAAILFPVFAQAREKARAITCVSNLKELALACIMYDQDYDEQYPGMWQWSPGAYVSNGPYFMNLQIPQNPEQTCETCPYVKNSQIYACPDHAIYDYNFGAPYPPVTDQSIYFSYGMAYPNMWGTDVASPPDYFPVGVNDAEFGNPAQSCMLLDSGAWPGTSTCNSASWAGIYNYACSAANARAGRRTRIPTCTIRTGIAIALHTRARGPRRCRCTRASATSRSWMGTSRRSIRRPR